MVLAHCPATGHSYAVDPIWGKYETVVPEMLDRLLFSLTWWRIDATGFVFDVLKKMPETALYRPHREFSYEQVRKLASEFRVTDRTHEPA